MELYIAMAILALAIVAEVGGSVKRLGEIICSGVFGYGAFALVDSAIGERSGFQHAAG